jgi:NADPH-dependent glutamate synthase beta subunit-like oxidoreductase
MMQPQHVVVIVGGAVAGSEAAYRLAQRGVLCAVLEQNERPYGKIEDGLPRWHVALRLQEQKKIDDKLAHPAVHFVPRTKLGRDLGLGDLLAWGASAVVLANGAWRDRPLPLPGIDAYVGRGFYYQNPVMTWFNHYPEPDYHGPQVELADDAIVVGGGLASLDIVKLLMLETVGRALAERGQAVDLYEMERRGIHRVLADLALDLPALGLRGCTLVYRRRIEEMPLAEAPEAASPEQRERTRATRRKLLQNFVDKYLFRVGEQRMPIGLLPDRNRLGGLRLAAVAETGGRVAPVPGSEADVRSRLVVSSIGSLPEPILGIAMQGEVYRITDERTGALAGLDGVFAIGNAVTGKGNILVSVKHGRVVSEHMLEHYLTGSGSGFEEVLDRAAAEAESKVAVVAARLAARAPLSAEAVAQILRTVRALQARAGYSGSYPAWLERLQRQPR